LKERPIGGAYAPLLSILQDARNNLFRFDLNCDVKLCFGGFGIRHSKNLSKNEGREHTDGGKLLCDRMKNPREQSSAQPTATELRRGIERWENEGGRLFPRVIRDAQNQKELERSRRLNRESLLKPKL
jgi:hypothetical protein